MNRITSRVRSWLLGTVAGLLGLAALAPVPAHAVVGTVDPVPAATVLVPYFEVDLGREDGPQTTIRLTNTTATAILSHVTLWSDLGVPTLNFTVYQQGYVTSEIDLRLVFKGVLPASASAGQDPTDTISPKGSASQDINFASCSGLLPPTRLPQSFVDHLRTAHTGVADAFQGGKCLGSAKGDNIARGYVTIDAVNNCTLRSPNDANYFTSDITAQNVLAGNVTYTHKAASLASSAPLVPIEADFVSPLTTGAGTYTFYGSMNGYTAADHREPVFATSDARYFNSSASTGLRTDLIVWRDPGTAVQPFTCGTLPAPFPLPQRQVLVFDDQENPTNVNTTLFGLAAQRVPVSSLTSNVGGHVYLNLTRNTADAANQRAQSFVVVQHNQTGSYGSGAQAVQVTNASGNPALNFTLGN